MRALKSKHSQTLYGLNPDFPPFLAQICDAEYNSTNTIQNIHDLNVHDTRCQIPKLDLSIPDETETLNHMK